MTSFVHTQYPAQHPGVARAEQIAQSARRLTRSLDGAKGLASLLLAAVVSALLVVANQVIDTWTDGHLLMAWIAMWVFAFAAIAILAGPARVVARSLRQRLQLWSERRRQAVADDRLWDLALRDARVMAEISRAMTQDASRDVRGYY